MKTIKYLGYYAIPQIHKSRDYVLSATNKMEYICGAINKNGYNVEIVSASGARCFEKGTKDKLNNETSVKLFLSLGKKNRFLRVLSRWLTNFLFFVYLLFNTKKKETVIVYHSLGYMKIVSLIKRIKKIRLVLEVEEIYSDVIGDSKKRKSEEKLFNLADVYIFPTKLLDKALNKDKKPSVIIHGTYKVEEIRKNCFFMSDPEHKKKHLLYAGTFDPRKGGAAAAAAAAYLTSDYHIHILGFGTEDDTLKLKKIVDEISALGGATITMDGLLSGEEYVRFVQSCDVGFSTQMPDAAFNNTSFPSKVLSYMANGLRVVSVKIPALTSSAIGNMLFYYEGNDPKSIAVAVKSIDWNAEYNSREIILKLDERFILDIGEIL